MLRVSIKQKCNKKSSAETGKVHDSKRQYEREKWHNLAGKFLGSSEALRVQHDLSDQLAIGRRHRKAAEQLLEIVGQVRTTGVARVHRDEDGHIWVHTDLLPNQLNSDHRGCNIGQIIIIIIIGLFLLFVFNPRDLYFLPVLKLITATTITMTTIIPIVQKKLSSDEPTAVETKCLSPPGKSWQRNGDRAKIH